MKGTSFNRRDRNAVFDLNGIERSESSADDTTSSIYPARSPKTSILKLLPAVGQM